MVRELEAVRLKGCGRLERLFMEYESMPKRKKWTFEVGNNYNILHLLTGGTGRTDKHCLINCDRIKVEIERVRGKYVLLYLLSLPDRGQGLSVTDENFMCYLKEAYEIYNPLGAFEVVFVALGNNASVFDNLLLTMPWLAIPHEDHKARDYLETEYSIPHLATEKALYFAPDGNLLHDIASSLFYTFGPEFFPFSSERIDEILAEVSALQREIFTKNEKLSLGTLTAILGYEIVSSNGSKVPTSKLHGKTLGLFFFGPTSAGFEQAIKLLDVWESLKNEHREFEIVLINKDPHSLSYAKAQFQKKFGCTIPWYTLAVCGQRVCRIFMKGQLKGTDTAGDLIVLEPDEYEGFSYFAFNILEKFGPRAYPFTMKRAVELVKSEQQHKLVLGELLSPQTPLVRGAAASLEKENTRVSKLLGKRVLLLFAKNSHFTSGLFLRVLEQMCEKKEHDDSFEIIYMSMDSKISSPSSFHGKIHVTMWLVNTLAPIVVPLAKRLYASPLQLPAIAAFGADGHLEAKESDLASKNEWSLDYPFIKADMDEEVRVELIKQQQWGFEHLGRIGYD